MALITENFLKSRLLNSKISVFLSTVFSVLIMGLLGIIAINYNSLGDSLKENISFNLVINDKVHEIETQQLIKSLVLVDGVKSVNFISKNESAERLQESIGENFLDILLGAQFCHPKKSAARQAPFARTRASGSRRF